MEVTGVDLIYQLDSKGFYQPVYNFEVNIDKKENHNIYIPALKNK